MVVNRILRRVDVRNFTLAQQLILMDWLITKATFHFEVLDCDKSFHRMLDIHMQLKEFKRMFTSEKYQFKSVTIILRKFPCVEWEICFSCFTDKIVEHLLYITIGVDKEKEFLDFLESYQSW